jgi:hypothetical protein
MEMIYLPRIQCTPPLASLVIPKAICDFIGTVSGTTSRRWYSNSQEFRGHRNSGDTTQEFRGHYTNCHQAPSFRCRPTLLRTRFSVHSRFRLRDPPRHFPTHPHKPILRPHHAKTPNHHISPENPALPLPGKTESPAHHPNSVSRMCFINKRETQRHSVWPKALFRSGART